MVNMLVQDDADDITTATRVPVDSTILKYDPFLQFYSLCGTIFILFVIFFNNNLN